MSRALDSTASHVVTSSAMSTKCFGAEPPPISHPCCLSDTLLLCVPRSPKVVVVGSTNVDLIAYCPKLPRPGETLMGTNFVQCFGGKVCPLPTPDAHPH